MADKKTKYREFLAGCLFLILTGCASSVVQIEKSIEAEISESISFTAQDWAASAESAQLANAQQVDWLESFNDPALAKLIDEALTNNRELQAASANVERANALAAQAGAQLKPQANLAFASSRSGSPSSSIPEVSNQSVSLQLNWELDLWGRIREGQRAAVASAEAAAADYKYARYSLAAATAKSYFVSIESGLQSKILKDILASLEETSRIVGVQYDNGFASSQDVALVKSDLASSREQLIVLEASRREALRALEVLLGRYPSADISLKKELPTLPLMPPPGVPSDLLERRPDIVASERRVAAAFNALNEAKAARLPQLSLTSNVGGASTSLSEILNPAHIAWQLAGNLLAPLYDGGARKAQVEAATAEQKQALAAYAQTALNAFSEVENNLDQANTLVQRESELATALEEANKAFRIAQLMFKEGEISLLDLLSIQQRALSAESNKVALRRIALDQRVNLYLALGGWWLEKVQ